jgi:hypothetical protein
MSGFCKKIVKLWNAEKPIRATQRTAGLSRRSFSEDGHLAGSPELRAESPPY